MAKKSAVEKNNRRKRISTRLYLKRASLKAQIHNKHLSLSERFGLVMKLSCLPKDSARTRIRNRCELTGRPRGYYGKFKLSRNMLRCYASIGLIPGLVKASW